MIHASTCILASFCALLSTAGFKLLRMIIRPQLHLQPWHENGICNKGCVLTDACSHITPVER